MKIKLIDNKVIKQYKIKNKKISNNDSIKYYEYKNNKSLKSIGKKKLCNDIKNINKSKDKDEEIDIYSHKHIKNLNNINEFIEINNKCSSNFSINKNNKNLYNKFNLKNNYLQNKAKCVSERSSFVKNIKNDTKIDFKYNLKNSVNTSKSYSSDKTIPYNENNIITFNIGFNKKKVVKNIIPVLSKKSYNKNLIASSTSIKKNTLQNRSTKNVIFNNNKNQLNLSNLNLNNKISNNSIELKDNYNSNKIFNNLLNNNKILNRKLIKIVRKFI